MTDGKSVGISGNTVATEALIVTVAHRQLVSRYPNCQLSRGEGVAHFVCGQDTFKVDNDALDVMSKMLTHVTRELIGRQTFKFSDSKFVDFSTVKEQTIPLTDMFSQSSNQQAAAMLPASFEALPVGDAIGKMLIYLYRNVVKDN